MRKLYKIVAIAVAFMGLMGCKEDVPDVKFTDKGPDMTLASFDDAAYMGGKINFTVDLKDDFPLSTLKVKLMFDETVVSEKVIRTKEYGQYVDLAVFTLSAIASTLMNFLAKSNESRYSPSIALKVMTLSAETSKKSKSRSQFRISSTALNFKTEP